MVAPKTALDWESHNLTLTACRDCERLVAWREQVAREKRRAYLDWDYWGKPVPGFGDTRAHLLVVGLAPGAHGSNRTGRMFTGDASGEFLYAALHRAGFASQPVSVNRDDGLRLKDVFITAVCRCAPPGNKPLPLEITNCRKYLLAEVSMLQQIQGIVALGKIAFEEVMDIFLPTGVSKSAYKFYHGAFFTLPAGLPWLLASYHPSRQNTQTGRLTAVMFNAIWQVAAEKL